MTMNVNGLRLATLFSLAIAAIFVSSAAARESYAENGRPRVCSDELDSDEQRACQRWINNVRRPDNPNKSCCGDADAYIADSFVERDGKYYAIITRDYPATPEEVGVAAGTEIEIPDDKLNRAFADGGNPSGHGVVFMSPDRTVLCYFGPSLS